MSVSVEQCESSGHRRALGSPRSLALLSLLLAALLLFCNATAIAAPPPPEGEPPYYLIGPGDELQITVWQNSDLSTSVTVRPDGRITIPLVEDLMAAGKTTRDLGDDIAERLAEFVLDPLVTVSVLGGLGDLGQQVRILGDAAQPKALPYRSGMTLLDAIIAVGGLSRQADGNGTVILRESETGPQKIPVRLADLVRDGDGSANVSLMPGDVIIIPQGFLDGTWRVSYSVTASETFSDNIDLQPSGDREVGFITRAGPGISISGQTARVTAALNGNISGVHQAGGDDEGFSLDPRINGTSTTEISPDLLFFDLRTSISRQLLNTRQASSGSGASTSNRDFLVTLTASPYLMHRLGDFADVTWRYSFSPVLVDSGDNSDAFSHDASLVLESGDDFSFFGWTWSNDVSQEVRTGEPDITTASTDFDVTYPLWKGFSLLGAVGYEYRDGDSDNENNFDGLTWNGGFSWQPNPDLNLEATYGQRNNDESLDASLYYKVGPKTTVNASYSEALETSQQRAISNLSRVTIDPDTGELIDADTNQPFTGDLDPFTFQDETTRTRTLRLSASHNTGRDSFGLSGTAGNSEGGGDGDEDFYTATVTWSRTLSQNLSLNSGGSYDHSKFDQDNRTDDTYSANLGLNYRFAPGATANLSYDFQARDSSDSNEDFYENSVTLRFAFSF